MYGGEKRMNILKMICYWKIVGEERRHHRSVLSSLITACLYAKIQEKLIENANLTPRSAITVKCVTTTVGIIVETNTSDLEKKI